MYIPSADQCLLWAGVDMEWGEDMETEKVGSTKMTVLLISPTTYMFSPFMEQVLDSAINESLLVNDGIEI